MGEKTIEAELAQIKNINKDKGDAKKTITILGAGMAGLVAAYELRKLGHEVRIFEANDRVGGRVWTHRFSDGTYGEFGAMRIPLHHHYTRYYISEMGLTLRRFISAHQNLECFYDIRGLQVRMKDAQANLYANFLNLSSDQLKDPIPPDMFGRVITDIVQSLSDREKESLFTSQLATDRLRDLDRTSLGEFLRIHAGTDAAELIGTSTGLETFFDRATTMFLRDAVVDEGSLLHEIVGGMDLLPTELGEKVKDCITFNSQVIGIHRKDDTTIDLVIKQGDTIVVENCKILLCTLPFTILRKLQLKPLFSPGKMQAIRNLSYGSSTKVLLHCSERFWETKYGIHGGASQTDQIIRATYYPSDNAKEENNSLSSVQKYRTLYSNQTGNKFAAQSQDTSKAPGVLLGSYTWGQDARRIGILSNQDRRNIVIQHISRFHPEIAQEGVVDGDASIFWDSYKWMSGGAFSFLQPGDQTEFYGKAIAPEGNIHFAGEHCSLDNAWIQGAIESSLRAVKEIVAKE